MTFPISRHYHRDDFPRVLSIEDKIDIFADQVRGWYLYPAEETITHVANSSFIVLCALSLYFEMIGKFMEGYTEKGDSRRFFEKGVKDAAPHLTTEPATLTPAVLDRLYTEVRSDLYHTGMIGRGIVLTTQSNEAIAVKLQNTNITINPHVLIRSLQKHLDSYLRRLKDPGQSQLRQSFQTRFDWLHADAPGA